MEIMEGIMRSLISNRWYFIVTRPSYNLLEGNIVIVTASILSPSHLTQNLDRVIAYSPFFFLFFMTPTFHDLHLS